MNPVEWLGNLLPGGPFVIGGWIIYTILVAWLATGLLAVAACIHNSRLSRKLRKAKMWEVMMRDEIRWQEIRANSPGPQVTAKTLMDKLREPDA